jgi:hypothetical protein
MTVESSASRLGSVVTLKRVSFSYGNFRGISGYSLRGRGERGELLRTELSSELIDADGDRVGVGQPGERDKQEAGMGFAGVFGASCHGEPCSS